jgi:hypothetical protein
MRFLSAPILFVTVAVPWWRPHCPSLSHMAHAMGAWSVERDFCLCFVCSMLTDRHVGPIIVIGQLVQEGRRRHRQQLCGANHSVQKGAV